MQTTAQVSIVHHDGQGGQSLSRWGRNFDSEFRVTVSVRLGYKQQLLTKELLIFGITPIKFGVGSD
jgi:hypothetical protein